MNENQEVEIREQNWDWYQVVIVTENKNGTRSVRIVREHRNQFTAEAHQRQINQWGLQGV